MRPPIPPDHPGNALDLSARTHFSVGAVIRDGGGRYLLQRRDRRPDLILAGHLGLFGGTLEPGESAFEGLRRELAEELAFRPAPERLIWSTEIVFNPPQAALAPHHKTIYAIDLAPGEAADFVLGEGEAMDWRAPRDLADDAVVPWDHYAIVLDARRAAWRAHAASAADSPYRAWF